jgi:amino acid transporter
MNQTSPQLKRAFTMTGTIVMSAGIVIGVGLFTVSTNAVGFLGPLLLIGNLVALVVSVLTSLVYAELAACWPFSGGSYAYAYESWGKFGPFAGFLAAWCIIGAYLAVGAEALAFGNYFLSTIDFLGIWKVVTAGEVPFGLAAALASALILTYTIINWRGAKEVALSQKAVMFTMGAMIAVSIAVAAITSIDFKSYVPFIPEWFKPGTFALSCTLIWWAYAGQEVIGTMAEEIEHPTINIPRALIMVPFVVFIITATMQWAVLGIVPDAQILQDADAPFALALKTAGVGAIVFLLFMLAEFAGNLTTINPALTGSSRVIFALGRDGYLPTLFKKISKRNVPAAAIWTAGLGSILLLASKGLVFLAEISAFMLLFLYGFVALTVIVARFTRPEISRPFKVPFFPIPPLLLIGFAVWMILSLPKDVVLLGILWLSGASLFYIIWTRLPWGKEERSEPKFFRSESARPKEPTAEEMAILNRNFRRFLIRLAIIFGICLMFYAIPYIL